MRLLEGKTIYVVPCGANRSKNIGNLLDELISNGANVYVMPTKMCTQIVNMQELSEKYQVKTDFDRISTQNIPEEDVIIIAPCTFNTFNKIAYGIADSYSLSIIQTSIGKGKPCIIAPSMNLSYWAHPTIKHSRNILNSFPNVSVIHPEIIYNADGTINRVSMAPFDKVADNVYHTSSKIRYESKKVEFDLSDTIDENFNEFATVGRYLQDNQYSNGVAGFIAKRIKEGILVTSTGSSLGNLKPNQLSLITEFNNKVITWSGQYMPSSESPLVVEIFENFDCGVIVHGHCKEITYNFKKERYLSNEYLKYGEWGEFVKIKTLLDTHNKCIMKLHGEIILSTDFSSALKSYEDMYTND